MWAQRNKSDALFSCLLRIEIQYRFGSSTLQWFEYSERNQIGTTISSARVYLCMCVCDLISVYGVAPLLVKLEQQ